MKGLAEASVDLNKLLKKFENVNINTERFLLIERNIHGALFVYKQIYGLKKKANYHGHISGKSDTSSRRASSRFQKVL